MFPVGGGRHGQMIDFCVLHMGDLKKMAPGDVTSFSIYIPIAEFMLIHEYFIEALPCYLSGDVGQPGGS